LEFTLEEIDSDPHKVQDKIGSTDNIIKIPNGHGSSSPSKFIYQKNESNSNDKKSSPSKKINHKLELRIDMMDFEEKDSPKSKILSNNKKMLRTQKKLTTNHWN